MQDGTHASVVGLDARGGRKECAQALRPLVAGCPHAEAREDWPQCMDALHRCLADGGRRLGHHIGGQLRHLQTGNNGEALESVRKRRKRRKRRTQDPDFINNATLA